MKRIEWIVGVLIATLALSFGCGPKTSMHPYVKSWTRRSSNETATILIALTSGPWFGHVIAG